MQRLIRIVSIGESVVTNHYAYLPLAFTIILFSILINNNLYKYSKATKISIFIIISSIFINNSITFHLRKQEWNSSNLELFKSDFKKYPNSEILANTIGSLYFKSQSFDSSQYYYKRALDLDPTYFKASYNLGLTYEVLKENEKAIKYYKKTLKINPEYTNSLIGLLPLLYQNREYNAMIYYYKNYNGSHLNNENIFSIMGEAYYSNNEINKSITCYKSALFINTKNSKNLYNLAISYGKIKIMSSQ